MSTTDPRVRAAATAYGAMVIGHKGYEKANPETRAALEGDASAILEAADKADPLRDRKKLITRMAVGISKSHATQEPILSIEENGGMISVRLPDLATAILDGER